MTEFMLPQPLPAWKKWLIIITTYFLLVFTIAMLFPFVHGEILPFVLSCCALAVFIYLWYINTDRYQERRIKSA